MTFTVHDEMTFTQQRSEPRVNLYRSYIQIVDKDVTQKWSIVSGGRLYGGPRGGSPFKSLPLMATKTQCQMIARYVTPFKMK